MVEIAGEVSELNEGGKSVAVSSRGKARRANKVQQDVIEGIWRSIAKKTKSAHPLGARVLRGAREVGRPDGAEETLQRRGYENGGRRRRRREEQFLVVSDGCFATKSSGQRVKGGKKAPHPCHRSQQRRSPHA